MIHTAEVAHGSPKTKVVPLLHQLFEPLGVAEPNGKYCPETQTWEHRDWLQFSPVKHNQEM